MYKLEIQCPIFFLAANFGYTRSEYVSHLQGHNDVMTFYEDGWWLFWYQWKEETNCSYTLVEKLLYMPLSKENPWGCNHPRGRTCNKNGSGEQGLKTLCLVL